MSPDIFLTGTLLPAHQWMLQNGVSLPFSPSVNVGLTAISGQEANWTERVQYNTGPAHGLFQFELAGGTLGVLTAVRSRVMAAKLCTADNIIAGTTKALAHNAWLRFTIPQGDNLAVAFARLLLWCDPSALPAMDDIEGWWDCYLKNWRPGKPSLDRWTAVFPQALAVVKAHG